MRESGRFKRTKVLLDTDIGGDINDAICLAYLLREPACELMGISTVCGEVETRASVASALCRAAGRRIPIAAGSDATLCPAPLYPTPGGAGALKRWPHDAFVRSEASEFLYRLLCAHPREIVLIAIGNMTNVAMLFKRYPDAPGLLRGFYAMNGYFGSASLPAAWYNWNSWLDPVASRIAFSARVQIHRAIPLDVTDALFIPAGRAETFLPKDSALMRAVYDFGGDWLIRSNRLTLHDPLAAVCAFHPEICRFERGYVSVETGAPGRRGATVFRPDPEGNVEIARCADAGRFYQILRQTLHTDNDRNDVGNGCP